MPNILTAAEAANVLRCETTDANMLQLLPLVDAYIWQATGRKWELDSTIRAEAKSAAQILMVRAHEDPGALAQPANSLSWGLSACLAQLEAIALDLETDGVPDEELELVVSMPEDGATGVAVNANIVLVFNHEMAAGATSKVSLKTAAGATVASSNTLDVTTKILTVNPTSDLTAGAGYQVVIEDAPDVYGMTLTETLTFETA